MAETTFKSTRMYPRIQSVGGRARRFGLDRRDAYDVVDISSSGICLEHGRRLTPSQVIVLELRWAGIGKGLVRGRVVRSKNRFGIEFVSISRDAENLLTLLELRHKLQSKSFDAPDQSALVAAS